MGKRPDLIPRAERPLSIPTYDRSGQCVHPDVIRVERRFYDAELAMAVEPYPYGDDRLENPSVLSSNTGLDWAVPRGVSNPVVDPPSRVGAWNSDGDLVMSPDHRLLLFYRYNSGRGETSCYRTCSHDGISWGAPAKLFEVAQSGRFASPAVVVADNRFRMFYVDTIERTVNLCTSRDSVVWSDARTLFGFNRAWHLDATMADGWTYLLLNDGRALYLLRGHADFEWFLLTEGGWDRYGHDQAGAVRSAAIVSPSQQAWDDGRIYRSSCLVEGSELLLWYGAESKGKEWNVGYTSGPIPQ